MPKTVVVRTFLSIAFVSIFSIASVDAVILDQAASGLITGVTGTPFIGSVDGVKQDVSLGTRVAVAEELRTGQDDLVEILWARRAMILVRPQSTVMIHESNAGQTEVSLQAGSVRVAMAYHGNPTDMVIVQTPSSRVYTRGGIFEVDVHASPPSLLARVASTFSRTDAAIDQPPFETVRVLEGESGIEPLTSSGQSHMLQAGVQARIAAGMIEQTVEFSQNSAKGVGLTDTDRRQGTPATLTQRLVNVHITHAEEVSRQLSTPDPKVDQTATAAGSDLKTTIVSTSVGFPSTSSTQSGRTSEPGPPVRPAPSPGVTQPVPSLPPVQAPPIATPSQPRGHNRHAHRDVLDDDDKGGKHKHKGNDREHDYRGSVTSAIPTLPAVEVSIMKTKMTGLSESRGHNNRDGLKNVFDDDHKGGSKQKQKGNEPVQHYRDSVTSPLPIFSSVEELTSITLAPIHSRGVTNRDFHKDAFGDDGKGGKQKHGGNDRDQNFNPSVVTSPLPALSSVEIPTTLIGIDHSQAGGNNSRHLLKEAFEDGDRGGGKHHGKHGDRND